MLFPLESCVRLLEERSPPPPPPKKKKKKNRGGCRVEEVYGLQDRRTSHADTKRPCPNEPYNARFYHTFVRDNHMPEYPSLLGHFSGPTFLGSAMKSSSSSTSTALQAQPHA